MAGHRAVSARGAGVRIRHRGVGRCAIASERGGREARRSRAHARLVVVVPVLGPLRRIRRRRVISACHAVTNGAVPHVAHKTSSNGRAVLRAALGATWRAHRGQFAVMAIALTVVTAAILSQPLLSGRFLESLVSAAAGGPNGSYAAPSGYRRALVLLALTYAIEPLCTLAYVRAASRACQTLVAEIQARAFAMVMAQDAPFFDAHPPTATSAALCRECASVGDVLSGNLSRDRGLRSACEATGGIIVLMSIAPQLAPVLVALVLLASINAAVFGRRTKARFAAFLGPSGRAGSDAVATQALRHAKTVLAFAAARLECRRYLAALRRQDGAASALARSKSSLEALSRSAIYISLVCLYAWGGHLVATEALPLRTLVSGIGYTFSLVFATQGITNTCFDFARARASWRTIAAFLDDIPQGPSGAGIEGGHGEGDEAGEDAAHATSVLLGRGVDALGGPAEDAAGLMSAKGGWGGRVGGVGAGAGTGTLSLEVRSFRYPTRPAAEVLSDVRLSLRPSTVTALVGPSGAGKSTVVQLVSRLYRLGPQEGALLWEGEDAAHFSRRGWSDVVSVVGQEPALFPGTVMENIAYGVDPLAMPEAELEARVRDAAMAANAPGFISQLPQGYATEVGEGGGMLSGGQKQRVAIARAFVREAPVLVLDEATSALDAESERAVQEALGRLFKTKAVLVIAHRLATVVGADEIIVMDGGRAVARGTHAELLESSALYSRLVGAQQLC